MCFVLLWAVLTNDYTFIFNSSGRQCVLGLRLCEWILCCAVMLFQRADDGWIDGEGWTERHSGRWDDDDSVQCFPQDVSLGYLWLWWRARRTIMPIQSIILSLVCLGNVVLVYLSDVVLQDHNWTIESLYWAILTWNSWMVVEIGSFLTSALSYACFLSKMTLASPWLCIASIYLSFYSAEIHTILNKLPTDSLSLCVSFLSGFFTYFSFAFSVFYAPSFWVL